MESTDIKSLIDRTQLSKHERIGEENFIACAPGTQLHDVQELVEKRLEKTLAAPKRRKGNYQASDLESFIAMSIRWRTKAALIELSESYGQTSVSAKMLTRFNPAPEGEDPTKAGWGDDTITYQFPIGDQIKLWLANNGKAMNQAAFAAFLEDNSPDLAPPLSKAEVMELPPLPPVPIKFANPAEVITVAHHLQVNVAETYQVSNKLESGEVELMYKVENSTSAKGKGKVVVPPWFLICVPAFQGDVPRFFAVRLRYRAKDGQVEFFYELYRPADVFRKTVTFNSALAQLKVNIPLYRVV
jgi:uncharacterized protein YfdQ (DUF2303 family)